MEGAVASCCNKVKAAKTRYNPEKSSEVTV
jgi:hypothetical protein